MPNCQNCTQPFSFSEEDRALLERLAPEVGGERFYLPPPTLCPDCRAQRRYVWRGELHLFRRKSAHSGKNIITFYPPESEVTVYDNDEWWSDSFNPLHYGRDFDFSRPFFSQFQELLKVVPLQARSALNNENSDFTNCSSFNKNCYLVGGANHNEGCLFGNYVNRSKDCVECNFVHSCELCFECIDCLSCYNLRYSQSCSGCSDSAFLYGCRQCKNCFGSVNLNQKEFYYFNQPLSRDEYFKTVASLDLFSSQGVQDVADRFEKHRLNFPYRYTLGERNEDSTGGAIKGCKDSHLCFDATDLWDCRYCHWLHTAKSCMDIISWGFPAELCYECAETGSGSYSALFSITSSNSQNVLYSYYSMNSQNLFGCIGIKKGSYCILNKQYSKEEYEILVPKIIEHLRKTKEWGEFFPIHISPLPYNTSVAQDYFPLDERRAKALGAQWHYDENTLSAPPVRMSPPSISASIDQSIFHTIFTCTETGKPFKIIKPELDFYLHNRIPLPTRCFEARHQSRLKRRNPRKVWSRECSECHSKVLSSFSPLRPERILCEPCYQNACE